jgi:hypothetical protein
MYGKAPELTLECIRTQISEVRAHMPRIRWNHHVREQVKQILIPVTYLPSSEMVADMFAKALPPETFEKLVTT